MKTILLSIAALSLLVTAIVQPAAAGSRCTTSCYGNSCTTVCY